MRWSFLLCFPAILGFATAGESDLAFRDLKSIDELDCLIQARFVAPPNPLALGMSRAVEPASLNEHYVPLFNTNRDFWPENPAETKLIEAMEKDHLQVGVWVFGRAILDPKARLGFRALKGPAAVTRNTPRPAWYPTAVNPHPTSDALPDWNAAYPVARQAMKRFADGGSEFETKLGTWKIAARPVPASNQRCVSCHPGVALHQNIGGLLYAWRRVK